MSQKNVELVRHSNVLFNAGDLDAAVELMHPDVEFRDLQHAPDLPQVLHGLDSVRLVLRHWTDAYDDFGVEVYEYVDADPWVIADVRWHGRGKGSGIRVDVRQADACRVEDGKIVAWIVGYPDLATALKVVPRDG
jgi:ketosteroid isomerase-like protein